MSDNPIAQLLDWKNAHYVGGKKAVHRETATLTVFFDQIAKVQLEAAAKWFTDNVQSVQNPVVEAKTHAGLWRVQSVDPRYNKEGEYGIIEVTLALNLYTSANWAGAYLEANVEAPGNSQSSVTWAASDSPEKWLVVRFPHVDPNYVDAVAKSFASSYSNPKVRGEEITGEFFRISASVREEDDGTYSVLLTLATPRFVIKSYSDFGGSNEAEVIYVWNLPKAIAQNVVDAWKVAYPVASTASVSLDSEKRLVDLVLRRKVVTLENLTTDPINVACDTTITYHFGWGYTKAEVAVFLAAHNGNAGSGFSRTVRVETRGDGLYDVSVQETQITYDETKHKFTYTGFSGTNSTKYVEYGWNAPYSVLESVRAAFESSAVNEVATFEVKRNDGCSFDYVGTKTTSTVRASTFVATGAGGTVSVVATQDDPTAPAAATIAKRERVELDVRKNEKSSYDHTLKKRIVVEIPQASVGDSSKKILYGTNTDAPVMAANHRLIGGTIIGNDDGTFNFGITVRDISIPHTATSSGGTIKRIVEDTHVEGGNPANVPNPGVQAIRKMVDVSVSLKDDGTADWKKRDVTSVQHDSGDVVNGTLLFKVTKDVTEDGETTPSNTPTKGVSYKTGIKLNEDGTKSFERDKIEAVASDETTDEQDDGIVKTTRLRKRNADGTYSLADGELGLTDSRINDDGKLDIIKETLTLNASLSVVRLVTNIDRNEKDYEWRTFNTTLSARQFDARTVTEDGATIRRTNESRTGIHKFRHILLTRTRTIAQEIQEEYSLSPLQSSSGAAPTIGERRQEVALVRAGLWRRLTITTTEGEWSGWTTSPDGWLTFAPSISFFENDTSQSDS